MALRVVPPIMQFAFALMCFHLLGGCNDRIVDPPLKNPREYTWTIDTLAYPGSIQTLMYDVWASSPQDVYVVGHNERAGGRMWHYDGRAWTSVKLHILEGGPFTNIGTLSGVQGFRSNDIFVTGEKVYQNTNPPPNFLDSSLVLRYDGTRWQEVKFERQRVLQSIWGRNPNDIWFGGINGTLYHYDGVTMRKDSVPLLIPKDADPFYNFYSITGSHDGDVYMLLYAPYPRLGGERYYIFARHTGTWVTIDSVFSSYRKRLWMSPSGSLYAVGHGVYRRVGNSWQQLFGDELNTFGIAGSEDNNMFIVGAGFRNGLYYGVVHHYNGSAWFQFDNFLLPDVILYDVWTDGREVFAVGNTTRFPQVSIVVHGK